jgi:hypothetical protein
MLSFKAKFTYGYVIQDPEDAAKFSLGNPLDPFRREVLVVAENLPTAITKIYQSISEEERARMEHRLQNAKKANTFPSDPKEIKVIKLEIEEIFGKVIQ